ncbi:DUF2809 domain-containing protein [Petroclostridium sp. X23]|uniref:ribosomal maturation YjgA family protein n=1 Tax=Petroclostridium sp. X23 TaxID=3045146 RepID=UPI0024ACE1DA|nr:DUF2809 domain-containing protein [Petroclostridium sp. X23]WHH57758.1 DUF2809 domain-containing protein [Petroclostridium sp. X23]
MKRRLIYSVLSFACFTACVLIVELFSNNHFIRGFTGDIIIILLIYFFIKILYDFHPLKLIIFTLLLAFTTELLQYIKLINILGLEHNRLAQLIIGSVFDPFDLLAYTIGAIIVYVFDIKLVREIV